MKIGIIVEGFNEGERLRRCLDTVLLPQYVVTYVDSGSTDGSLELARARGCDIVHLDMSKLPFSCARARNTGFARLMELDPSLEYIHFIDADCELDKDWLANAVKTFESDPKLAVVCGRLREKNRNESIYGRLCDMEWDGPVGDVATCGGIATMRARDFRDIGLFHEAVPGGEEIELCGRLIKAGHRVVRTRDEMGTHDADMTRFGQWWGRTEKHGYYYAQWVRHGPPDKYKARQVKRAVLWAGVMPVVAVAGAVAAFWWLTALALPALALLAYISVAYRAYRVRRRLGNERFDAWLYGWACLAAKFPQFAGQVRYWMHGGPGRWASWGEANPTATTPQMEKVSGT